MVAELRAEVASPKGPTSTPAPLDGVPVALEQIEDLKEFSMAQDRTLKVCGLLHEVMMARGYPSCPSMSQDSSELVPTMARRTPRFITYMAKDFVTEVLSYTATAVTSILTVVESKGFDLPDDILEHVPFENARVVGETQWQDSSDPFVKKLGLVDKEEVVAPGTATIDKPII